METGKKVQQQTRKQIKKDSANEKLAEKPKVAVEWHSCEEHKKKV